MNFWVSKQTTFKLDCKVHSKQTILNIVCNMTCVKPNILPYLKEATNAVVQQSGCDSHRLKSWWSPICYAHGPLYITIITAILDRPWKGNQSTRTNLLSGSARHGVYLPLGLREPVERQIALVLLELDRDWGWGRGILGSGAVWNICMV